ncbi:MAG TPA: hypothetical protein VL337_06385 [Acidimicrobiales bacterium]|nr:hypothetical protein [Acidimicrobiales bacterium]
MAGDLPDEVVAARADVARLVAERDRQRGDRAALDADLARRRADEGDRRAAGDVAGAAAARAEVDALVGRRRNLAADLAQLDRDLHAVVAALLVDDFTVEADVPLVLLPVRIETRFTMAGDELRVRIYPDDVHITRLDDGLSDAEQAAGRDYWQAVWVAGDTAEAWPALVAAVGPRRAGWVGHALTPRNLGDRPAGAPDFPDDIAPRSNARARATALPDRFHVLVTQGGVTVHAPGAAVPDELTTGLPGLDDLDPAGPPPGELALIDAETRWMTAYDEAQRVGMAVTVPLADLPDPGAAVDRVVVLGVRSSLDPDDAAARLERLLLAHRFGVTAEFVAPGTPTNNTATDRAGWSGRTPPAPPPAAPVPTPAAGTAAGLLARAFGVDGAGLAPLPGGDGSDVTGAFHTALWEATWGQFLERVVSPRSISPLTVARLRRHWIDRVRGRGPLPTLRVGDQPYGLLPLLPTDAAALVPEVPGVAEGGLVQFLERLLPFWRAGAASVPTVMDGDLDAAVREAMGMSPVMVGLRVRTITNDRCYEPVVDLLGGGDNAGAQREIDRHMALHLSGGVTDPSAIKTDWLLDKDDRDLALPLADGRDQPFIEALLGGGPVPRPTSVLQALLGMADRIERSRVERVAGREEIDQFAGIALHQSSERLPLDLVRRAVDVALDDRPDLAVTAKLVAAFDDAGAGLDLGRLAARQALPPDRPRSAFALLTSDGEVPVAVERQGRALGLVAELVRAQHRRAEVREAMEAILRIDALAERAQYLAETLDCTSHRLDAWLTSIATNRLDFLRDARPTGCVLGAYGLVEHLRPEPPVAAAPVDGVAGTVLRNRGDGGFVHAPSISHAATAGVLRSGRLTHQAGAAGGALEVDLSSTRVREAMAVVDGVRNGQPLGALLGYRLERWLHERTEPGVHELDRYVYVLRVLAPVVAGKLTDRGAAAEAVAATNVVDGVAILELLAGSEAAIRQKLADGPDDQRFGPWAPPAPGEVDLVVAAIADLHGLHDAVADLLLSEAVHQLVLGNTSRAAAALDAIGGGEALPPEPDVVRTPLSGTALTHRLLVVVPEPRPAVAGWAGAPRAAAEPALEAWAQGALGPPPVGVAAAGLCALDVVYDADGADPAVSTVSFRIGAPLDPMTWQVARSLRTLVAGARPVDGAALGREEDGADLAARAAEARAALADALAAVDVPGVAPADVVAALAPFGVRAGLDVARLDADDRTGLAAALVAEARRRLAAAGVATSDPVALRAVFGDDFLALAVIVPPAAGSDAFAAALGPEGVDAADGAEIRPWLARAASVRASVARYSETVTFRDALGRRPALRVCQLPVGAPSTWVGLPFADAEPLPPDPVTATVLEWPRDVALAGGARLAGFVVDQWTEVVPRRVPGPDGTLEATHTTGLAVHADGPGARAPQAILLALSPDGKPWGRDKLADALDGLFELARIRGVTLERLPAVSRLLPALYFQEWSLQGEPAFHWGKLYEEARVDAVTKFVRAEP